MTDAEPTLCVGCRCWTYPLHPLPGDPLCAMCAMGLVQRLSGVATTDEENTYATPPKAHVKPTRSKRSR